LFSLNTIQSNIFFLQLVFFFLPWSRHSNTSGLFIYFYVGPSNTLIFKFLGLENVKRSNTVKFLQLEAFTTWFRGWTMFSHTHNYSYTKFSNSSTYMFLFRLLIFCDTHINTVSSRCKNTSTSQTYDTCSMYLCSESSFKTYIVIAFSPDSWVQLYVHVSPAVSWRKCTDALLWKFTFDNI